MNPRGFGYSNAKKTECFLWIDINHVIISAVHKMMWYDSDLDLQRGSLTNTVRKHAVLASIQSE